MSRNKLLNEKYLFWGLYALVLIGFLSKGMRVGWDASEYLAFGKNMFSEYGYDSLLRPPIWSLVLGLLWKIGLPMPFTMQALTFLIYAIIPLITYFSFKDSKRFIGIMITSHIIFFQYSHYPLSHILATFFLVLAFSTKGYVAGAFSVLSGLTRFTFMLSILFICWKDKKKWLAAIGVGTLYLTIIWAFTGNPLTQLINATNTINAEHYLWFWEREPEFYFKALLFSPLLILGLSLKNRFTLGFLSAFTYFSFLPHKEYRFFIDMLPYLIFSFAEIKKKLWPYVVLIGIVSSYFILIYKGIPSSAFDKIPDGSSVVGMHPEINAYKDVVFYAWFDYMWTYNNSAEYCIYAERSIPCNNENCTSKKEEFKNMCHPLYENPNYGLIVGKVNT